ncbi:Glutamate receptor ionotropic, delta-2 [Triplophysa tibetana]|uniref:Glutamate receptor ionotropic, delta-2 n=1 Tax=Triplophysa tibetana TaxID=1572043 RepID=A0A5A9NYZ1_9TELE|nr:Glutamate receptor ionotropic, delta-2 [Triplophysa tibetana]
MKVFPAVLFLITLWSLEWEPVLPDSIIHIGKRERSSGRMDEACARACFSDGYEDWQCRARSDKVQEVLNQCCKKERVPPKGHGVEVDASVLGIWQE